MSVLEKAKDGIKGAVLGELGKKIDMIRDLGEVVADKFDDEKGASVKSDILALLERLSGVPQRLDPIAEKMGLSVPQPPAADLVTKVVGAIPDALMGPLEPHSDVFAAEKVSLIEDVIDYLVKSVDRVHEECARLGIPTLGDVVKMGLGAAGTAATATKDYICDRTFADWVATLEPCIDLISSPLTAISGTLDWIEQILPLEIDVGAEAGAAVANGSVEIKTFGITAIVCGYFKLILDGIVLMLNNVKSVAQLLVSLQPKPAAV